MNREYAGEGIRTLELLRDWTLNLSHTLGAVYTFNRAGRTVANECDRETEEPRPSQ